MKCGVTVEKILLANADGETFSFLWI